MTKGVVVVDTNLMVLLIVGSASKDYISKHKRLTEYTPYDFDMLGLILSGFSDIVLLPHILAETSNLIQHIASPARADVRISLRKWIEACVEVPVPSANGARREEFKEIGLTDAVILDFCAMNVGGISPTLITTDTGLADVAHSLDYSVIDYKIEFMSRPA